MRQPQWRGSARSRARRSLLLVLLLASGVLASLARAERPGAANAAPTFPARAESPPLVPAGLREQAEEQGSARVIVRLRMSFVPEGRLRRSEALDQRDRIADLRGRLKEAVSDSGTRVVREFQTVPYVALELSPRGLAAAERSSAAQRIQEDRPRSPTLAESTPLIGATDLWAAGSTGSGQTVAILDTGADALHPFLSGKVVDEACYSAGSDCPNRFECPDGYRSGGTVHLCDRGLQARNPCRRDRCRHGRLLLGCREGREPHRGPGLLALQRRELRGRREPVCARLNQRHRLRALSTSTRAGARGPSRR